MERDGNTSKRKGEGQEGGESSGGKRLKISIAAGDEAFACDACHAPLRPPIFQCPEEHFFCTPCRDNLPEDKCSRCSRWHTPTVARSLGMEHVVQSILVDCRHAERGCTEKTAYCDKEEHEKVCSHAPSLCPESGCGFAGKTAAELLDHLTGQHKWPSTTFMYWKPFDLLVVEPGTHVLRCEDDGQLFLVSVRPAVAPPGLAVSLVCVLPYLEVTRFGCTVSFSSLWRHRSTSTLDDLQPLRLSDWPPKECICVLHKDFGRTRRDDGVKLTINIVCADPDDEDDDGIGSYIGSDEEDDDDSS